MLYYYIAIEVIRDSFYVFVWLRVPYSRVGWCGLYSIGAGVLFVIESEYIVFKGLPGCFFILIVAAAGLRFVGKSPSLEESALYGISWSFW